jgi:hypothetical protein
VPSLTPLMHSILDRLLELLPEEPRAAKLLNDIRDPDERLGELFDRAVQAAQAEDAEAVAAREVPASELHPRHAAKHRAAS